MGRGAMGKNAAHGAPQASIEATSGPRAGTSLMACDVLPNDLAVHVLAAHANSLAAGCRSRVLRATHAACDALLPWGGVSYGSRRPLAARLATR
jgi:hypothetical protein